MINVYLVRHGQASAGTDNYDRLSTLGIRQAQLLGDYWKKQSFKIDGAFCGTLQRQQHTAELVLAKVDHIPSLQSTEVLNEYDHHTIDKLYGEGLNSDMAVDFTFDQYLEIMTRWQNAAERDANKAMSWQTFSMQGWIAVQEAVAAFEQQQKQTDINLVFFTSGGVIASVVKQVLGLDFDMTMRKLWQTRNASITRLLFDEFGYCMVNSNTIPHLEMHFDPSLDTQI